MSSEAERSIHYSLNVAWGYLKGVESLINSPRLSDENIDKALNAIPSVATREDALLFAIAALAQAIDIFEDDDLVDEQ